MNDLGDRIKKLRTERGLSIRNLAGKVGYAPSTISRIEKGESSPDVKTTFALAQFFNVSHDYILYGVETPKVSKNIYNVYSKSPLYFSEEYLTIINLIDKMTRDQLIMLKGTILAVFPEFQKALKEANIS